MQKKVCLLLALLMVFATVLSVSLYAGAASIARQDGLEITIKTDKNEYAADDDIQISLRIRNDNYHKLEGVSIETLLPEGLVLQDRELKASDIEIKAKSSYSASCVANLSEDLKPNEETKAEVDADDDEEELDDEEKSDDKGKETKKKKNGTAMKIVLWVVVIAEVAVLVFALIKLKSVVKITSFFLCLAIVLTMSSMNAFGADDDIETATVNKTVSVNGEEYAIKIKVSYIKVEADGDVDINLETPETEAPPEDEDDATDIEDDEVAEGSMYKLSASEIDVLAESNTPVVFKVNSDLTLPYFELYCDGSSTGVMLYDDGDYSAHYDDIPNDGCYTGVLNVNYDVEKDYIFTAKTMVGEEEITTNEVELFVYYEFTDEQCTFMNSVSEKIKTIITETRSDLKNETNGDVIADKVGAALQTYLNGLQSEGKITNLFVDHENYFISYEYADSGVLSCVTYYKVSTDQPISSSQNSKVQQSSTVKDEFESFVSSNVDYTTYKEKALFMIYCDENVPINDGTGSLFVESSKYLASQMELAGFDTDFRYSVTVDDFKTMQDYQYIRIACHGSFVSGLGIDNAPVICTDQTVTDENRDTYASDLKKQRLFVAHDLDDNGNPIGDGVYWIHPDFFTCYYDDNPLKANIVHVSCCKGAYKNDLVNALVDVGADSVVAFTETVYTGYDVCLWEVIISELLEGNNIESAVNSAIEEIGDTDNEWHQSIWPDETRKNEVAECKVFGDKSTLLHNQLDNGCFDVAADFFGNYISNWSKYGDARSIFKLSGISPKSWPKMAIISSGFGSMNGETESFIYQTFLVPEDANSITFSYDVVSEEPMEFVGSDYNDSFTVELLDTDGNVLDILAYESVNSSSWYEVTGINFPGGDDTTFHTRWTNVTSTAISKYRGKLVVLRISVEDAGDSIYDTAALIDSITIN